MTTSLPRSAAELLIERDRLEGLLAASDDWRALIQLHARRNRGESFASMETSALEAMLMQSLAANPIYQRHLAVIHVLENWPAGSAAASGLVDVNAAPSSDDDEPKPDDLKKIRGIDRALERRLRALGIWTFDQIARWTADDVQNVSATLGIGRQISTQNWIEQAAILNPVKDTIASVIRPSKLPDLPPRAAVTNVVSHSGFEEAPAASDPEPHFVSMPQPDAETQYLHDLHVVAPPVEPEPGIAAASHIVPAADESAPLDGCGATALEEPEEVEPAEHSAAARTEPEFEPVPVVIPPEPHIEAEASLPEPEPDLEPEPEPEPPLQVTPPPLPPMLPLVAYLARSHNDEPVKDALAGLLKSSEAARLQNFVQRQTPNPAYNAPPPVPAKNAGSLPQAPGRSSGDTASDRFLRSLTAPSSPAE